MVVFSFDAQLHIKVGASRVMVLICCAVVISLVGFVFWQFIYKQNTPPTEVVDVTKALSLEDLKEIEISEQRSDWV